MQKIMHILLLLFTILVEAEAEDIVPIDNEHQVILNISWINGTVNSEGKFYHRDDRIASGLINTDDINCIECTNGFFGLVAFYDNNKHFLELTPFQKNLRLSPIGFPPKAKYCLVVINNGSNEISPAEGFNCLVYANLPQAPKKNELFGSSNQICRLGWEPYSQSTPPEQSIASYSLAYKNGCRIMLVDIRITADGHIVCFHDDDLGYALKRNMVRHLDGSILSTDEKQKSIASLTLAELNNYDFGIYKDPKYVGTKILLLEDFLRWCSLTNCIPMLETKSLLSEDEIKQISAMCRKYSLDKRVIVADGYNYLDETISLWIENLPYCTAIVRGGSSNYSARLNNAITFTKAGINAYISFTSIETLTEKNFDEMNALSIGASYSEITSESQMELFFDKGLLYRIPMIVSSYIRIHEWIEEHCIRNAD